MKYIIYILMALSANNLLAQVYQKVDNKEFHGTTYNNTNVFYEGEWFNFNHQSTTDNFNYEANPTNVLNVRLKEVDYPNTSIFYTAENFLPNPRTRDLTLKEVGSIPGSINVSSSGATTYSIPIEVSPGSNGFQPNIAIVYSSQSGNGLAGWGWNLSGLSSINRSPQNEYFDSEVKQIQFDNSDNYSLNGQRILEIGTDLFAPEVGNSARITGMSPSSSGYDWFKVEDKNGTITEYGNNYDSKLRTSKGTFSWQVNKVTDVNGNYIEYHYGFNDGESFIKKITYTGNDRAGVSPYASIEFNYTVREDKNLVYVNGASLNSTLLLQSIDVKYGSQTVRTYYLGYTLDKYSKLYQISRTDKNGTQVNSTIFEYYDDSDEVSAIEVDPDYPSAISDHDATGTKTYFGDFNGDGISDRIVVDRDYDGGSINDQSRWYMQYGQYFNLDDAGSYVSGQDKLRTGKYSFVDPTNGAYQFTTYGQKINHYGFKLLFDRGVKIADFNNDGYDDLCLFYLKGYSPCWSHPFDVLEPFHDLVISLYLSDGSKLVLSSLRDYKLPIDRVHNKDYAVMNENFIIGNFDDDDYLEIVVSMQQFDYWENFGCSDLSRNNSGHYGKLRYIDLYNQSGTLSTTPSYTEIHTDGDEWFKVFPININNDKKTDILLAKLPYQHNKIYNIENGGLVSINDDNSLEDFHNDFDYRFGDFNGDGLTDIIYWDSQKWRIKYNQSTKFSERMDIPDFPTFAATPQHFTQVHVADFNGDGKSDILWADFDENNLNPIRTEVEIHYSIGDNKFSKKEYELFNNHWILYSDFDFNIDHGLLGKGIGKIIDFNGDGNADLYSDNVGADCSILTFNFDESDLQINKIWDGLNNRYEISYDPITTDDSDIYNWTWTYSISSTILNMRGGYHVTSKILNYDYSEDYLRKIEYGYEDGLLHRKGKGFLGFKQNSTTTYDYTGSTTLEENRELNSTYFQLYTDNTKKYRNISSNSVLVSEVEYTVSDPPVSLGNMRYFLYDESIFSRDLISQSATLKFIDNIDDDANVLESREYVGNSNIQGLISGNSTSYSNSDIAFSSKTINVYDDIVNLWSQNRLVSTTSSSIRNSDILSPASTPFSRTQEFEYYGANNGFSLKKSITDPNESPAVDVLNEYKYDLFGNKIFEEISQIGDPDLAARSINYQMDDLGRFTTGVRDALGQTLSSEFDQATGNIKTKTDNYGKVTTYYYNNLYSLISVDHPTDLTESVTLSWEVSPNSKIIYKIKTDGNALPYSYKYYNSFGMLESTINEHYYVNGPAPSGFDLKTTSKNIYASDGTLLKVYDPDFTLTPGGYGYDLNFNYTEYIYDDYMRTEEVKYHYHDNYDGSYLDYERVVYDYTDTDDDENYITVTYPDGKIIETVTDNAGLTTEVNTTEPVTGGSDIVHTVKYDYANHGQITEAKTEWLNSPNDLVVTYEYDRFGRLERTIDPNAGTFEYQYNNYDELVHQSNPNGNKTIEYDDYGRVRRVISEDNTPNPVNDYEVIYNYNNKNELYQIVGPREIGTLDGMITEMDYDGFGRMTDYSETIDDQIFSYTKTYNQYGFPDESTYPSGVKIKNIYNSNGFLKELKRVDNSLDKIIVRNNVSGVDGKMREARFSYYEDNNVLVPKMRQKFIYDKRFTLDEIYTDDNTNSASITPKIYQKLQYDFNHVTGNLMSRTDATDANNIQSEQFQYDGLDRLKAVVGPLTQNLKYNNDGTISENSLVGDYYYGYHVDPEEHSNGTNDAKAIQSVRRLDASTFRVDSDVQNLDYTSFNSIKKLEEGSYLKEFVYGPDEQRRVMGSSYDGTMTEKKYYQNGYEKTEDYDPQGNIVNTKQITYVPLTSSAYLAIMTNDNGAGPVEKSYYVFTDHLGSIHRIVDEDGNEMPDATFSFDAWGNMRKHDNWGNLFPSANNLAAFDTIGRGFTGHEHLRDHDIINMNGRIYDPVLGQFMQADNVIQDPSSSQSYNRYSYVRNNPLKYTDPSGEEIVSLLIMGAVAAYSGYKSYRTSEYYGVGAGAEQFATSMAYMALAYGLTAGVGAGVESALTSSIGADLAGYAGAISGAVVSDATITTLQGGKYTWQDAKFTAMIAATFYYFGNQKGNQSNNHEGPYQFPEITVYGDLPPPPPTSLPAIDAAFGISMAANTYRQLNPEPSASGNKSGSFVASSTSVCGTCGNTNGKRYQPINNNPYNQDGTPNTNFKGHGLESNDLDIVGLFAGVYGVLKGGMRLLTTSNIAKTSTALTKNSVIEGFRVSNHAWRKSGLGRGATEELISDVIIGARKAGSVITETGTGKFSGNVINIFNHNGVKVVVDETRKLIMSIRPVNGFKLP